MVEMVRKQKWGRRSSDNQPYPKIRPDKSGLPTELERVTSNRTLRERTIDYMLSSHNESGVALCGWEFDTGIQFMGGGHSDKTASKLSKVLMSSLLKEGHLRIVKDPWVTDAGGTFEENPGAYQLVFTESGRNLYGLDDVELDIAYGEMEPTDLTRAEKMERVVDAIEAFEHERWEIGDILKVTGGSKRLALEERRGAIDKELIQLRKEKLQLKVGD